jgi:ribosomal protein L23
MKSVLKFISAAFVIVISTIACDNNPSLQKYYVDSKENSEFISVDLPSSIIQLKDTEVSEELKNTLETIKKINFLALQLTETNEELYTVEKQKVNTILKNPKYKQLMRMNIGKANVSVNFIGEDDAIDEVVLFGADNNKGFAVVRVIGENMNPSDIMKLANEIKLDGDSEQMKQLAGLMKSIQ